MFGLNVAAAELYESLLDCDSSDISIRARFNLSQLIRGSGKNTGLEIKGFKDSLASSESRQDRISDLQRAHQLCNKTLI